MIWLVAAFALSQVSGSQSAQVIGGNDARACFMAAASSVATRADQVVCERALADLRLSDRDRAATYVNYGVVLRKRGRLDQAIAAHDRAIELAPELAEAYLNRASALSASGRDAAALIDLDQALALDLVRREVAYFNRALIHERADRLDAAYADLQAARAANPDYAPALRALARYQVAEG